MDEAKNSKPQRSVVALVTTRLISRHLGGDQPRSHERGYDSVNRLNVFVALSASLLALMETPLLGAPSPRVFRAGAYAIEVSPTNFPVIINGGFLEGRANKVNDPLHARCLVLDDGTQRIALAVVDTCMLPREICDEAKRIAHGKTGIPVDRMLISATHTHSAPSAMGCLGCPPDVGYARTLPDKIADGIERAIGNSAPARIGWSVVDDFQHTHNRRWIYRSDRMKTDPFGEKTVRANMHPGYQNPDCIGPSGPVDPGLSVLSIRSPEGRPIAVLANYSMHYFGSAPVSADYCGRFAEKIKSLIGADAADPPFVGIMTQGTSGDLMWMDYGEPQNNPGLDAYAEAVALVAYGAYQKIRYREWVSLSMAEATIRLRRRTPDEARLTWAKALVVKMQGRKPQNQPEVYAHEQIYLHEQPVRDLKLQAIRIGDLGIAAIPNEVFAITGLKIKAQSPLVPSFTIELANGSEGYIPPPEQHKLGGYTTWPARTAALEVEAEPKITEAVLGLLEKVSGKTRRKPIEVHGGYAKTVLASKPVAYWRFNEFGGPTAWDSSGHGHHASYEDGIAFYLAGPPSAAFSSVGEMNHCVHLAGGRVLAAINGLGEAYSVEMWFWNGLPANVQSITGFLFSRGVEGASSSSSDRLALGGANGPAGPLRFDSHAYWHSRGWESRSFGETQLILNTWHHVVLVRDRNKVTVYLDGRSAPEISALTNIPDAAREREIVIGGRWQPHDTFEGKVDEVAIYDRALSSKEIARHFRAAGTLESLEQPAQK